MSIRDMSEEEADRWFVEQIKRTSGRDDVEEFEQVSRAGGLFPRVWYRQLGFDFMASASIEVGKARRTLYAVDESRSGALTKLAELVLEYQYPSGRFRNKSEAIIYYRRSPSSDWRPSDDA